MFILTTISDLIQIAPEAFEKPSIQALKDNINSKYANRVVHKIGLCICLHDILSTSEGLIGHGTGIVNVNVEFRLLVFRPFKGEIIQGRIKKSDRDGITINLGFFNDIRVPCPVNLFDGTRFHAAEQVWVWTTEEGTELFIEQGETVRFRVESEIWNDQSPEQPAPDDTEVPRETPYSIVASMQQAGLGPIIWW